MKLTMMLADVIGEVKPEAFGVWVYQLLAVLAAVLMAMKLVNEWFLLKKNLRRDELSARDMVTREQLADVQDEFRRSLNNASLQNSQSQMAVAEKLDELAKAIGEIKEGFAYFKGHLDGDGTMSAKHPGKN